VRHDGVFGMLISLSEWKKLPDLVANILGAALLNMF
jgi:hypothetical protein